MSCSLYTSISWQYPSSGPAPPSPVVVNTVPQYFNGRPTPPPSPPRARATLTVDDYASCPPTPTCVPFSVEQDPPEWSDALNSGTSQSTSSETPNYWSTSELDHSTSFADPLTDETLNDSGDQAQYDEPVAQSEPLNVSDCLLYARETYAWPNPVMIMMRRAMFDMHGLETQSVDWWACGKPLKLFSLTGGHTPMTGLPDHDRQSFKYYDKRPHPSPLREPECFLSYRYSISSIKAIQHSLRTEWSSVYPAPIPPVIIRSRDLIGPHSLSRRHNGSAFVVPTEDSIWGTIRQRGIDLDFRPTDPSLTVDMYTINKGAAFYHPQHIVASKFAVNVFLEVADSASRSNPLCEYLGAFVLQAMDGITIRRDVWADIDPRVQQAVYNRVPGCFGLYKHPSLGWPRLRYVRFRYYKWDRNIVGLADESPDRTILTANQDIFRHAADGERVNSESYLNSTDSDSHTEQYCNRDADQDTTPSAYSPEQNYVSFMDFSPCA